MKDYAFWPALRRFWLAIRLTWRGQTAPRTDRSPYWEWLDEGEALLNALLAAIKQAPPARFERLRYDGRPLRASTALRWLAFSFQRELPSLLRSGNPYYRAAFQAQALNLSQLLQSWRQEQPPADPRMAAALDQLIVHLGRLPAGERHPADAIAARAADRYTPGHESPADERDVAAMPPKSDDSGQSLLEYALILVLVAVVVIVILVLLGPTIRELFNNIVNSIAT